MLPELKFDPDSALQGMVAQLRHRGPDDAGIWLEPDAGLALGHTRFTRSLTSPRRPSTHGQRRRALGDELQRRDLQRGRAGDNLRALGCQFGGHSDTEVLLEAIAAWGFDRTLTRANGMFALAAWDRRERRLTLARDRLGKKPLYCWRSGYGLVFASELKALRAHPSFRARSIVTPWLSFFASAGYPDRTPSIAGYPSCLPAPASPSKPKPKLSLSPSGRRGRSLNSSHANRSGARSTKRWMNLRPSWLTLWHSA